MLNLLKDLNNTTTKPLNQNKMKTSELRIGNYLNYQNSTEIATVVLINEKHFDCRNEDEIFTPNGNYEPIKLIFPWLMIFGFKELEKDYRTFFKKGKFKVELSSSGNVYYGKLYIGYVHQLQNLYFALTGNELKIK